MTNDLRVTIRVDGLSQFGIDDSFGDGYTISVGAAPRNLVGYLVNQSGIRLAEKVAEAIQSALDKEAGAASDMAGVTYDE